MPQSEHETQALQLTCEALGELFGGSWALMAEVPDDEYPNEPSPDGILSDGTQRAAVEIKRLTGDATWNAYVEARRSLRRSLTPESGGLWYLVPWVDFYLPMDRPTRRLVKKSIEAQQHLRPGDAGSVRLPRSAPLELLRSDGPSYFMCEHVSTGRKELADAAAGLASGAFFLRDEGQHEHKFVTEACLDEFTRSLQGAALELLGGAERVEVVWDEEWELQRDRDAVPGSVQIVAITRVRDVVDSNEEAVALVLDDALAKFESRRWADLHVVALVNMMLDTEYLADAIQSYPDGDFADVDLILILDGDTVVPAWQRQ